MEKIETASQTEWKEMRVQEKRPAFDSLCECVGIHLSHTQQQWVDSRKSKADKEAFVREIYNSGGDYHFDVDCKKCAGYGFTSAPLQVNG